MALFVRPFAPLKLKKHQTQDFEQSYYLPPKLMNIMETYHYPAPPDSGAVDTNMPQLAYDPTTYPMPYQKPPTSNLGETRDSSLAYNSNQSHHGDPNHILKRSFSTPSVSMPSTISSEQQSSAGPSGEKKRNKLGYHRTSIACSHCRRRKIRCIASPEVPNRCTNCIRLKKECSFFPVDQQPTSDGRLPSQTAMGGPNVPTASPSPAISDQQPYPPMPAAPIANIGSPTPQGRGAEYFPSDPKSSIMTLPTDLSYSMREPPIGWMIADDNGNPISKSRDQSMAWRAYPVDSPINARFTPYLHTSAASTTWTASDTEAGNEAMAWDSMSSLERSASLSGEVLGSQQMAQYYQVGQDQSGDRQQGSFVACDMYSPPTADVSIDNVDAGTGQSMDLSAGPLVAGVVPPSNPLSWQHSQQLMSQQPPPPQHGVPYSRRRGGYGIWGYGDEAGTHQM